MFYERARMKILWSRLICTKGKESVVITKVKVRPAFWLHSLQSAYKSLCPCQYTMILFIADSHVETAAFLKITVALSNFWNLLFSHSYRWSHLTSASWPPGTDPVLLINSASILMAQCRVMSILYSFSGVSFFLNLYFSNWTF